MDSKRNKMKKDELKQLINKTILQEIQMRDFKKNVKYRTKGEQLNTALKEIKKHINEVNKLVTYTSKLKEELTEGNESYWKASNKALSQISETLNHIGNKVKNLAQ